ncbi:MAG: serine/threonine protein kinase, partial [Myxococcales bacterium]
ELAVGVEAGNFKKLAVLKTLREELAFDPDLIAMFLAEARLCARLNHSNLVQVYEVMEAPRPCIIMEYLECLSLFDIQQALGPELGLVPQLRIISDLLSGLQYAHDLCDYDGTPLGIIHRDVSPQNVVVTSEGRVKVLDFGIAKIANSPTQTQAGIVKGKMSYMSPEQLAGEPLDCRTDVYSVGCMLWRAATGKKLWAKMSTEDIMRCLVVGKIPAPSSSCEVDPKLERIVLRATAASRSDRYESAAALQAAVDEYLAEVAPNFDLHAWMQAHFNEHWTERRRAIHVAMADGASVPPVGLDRPTAVTALNFVVPRRTKLITLGVVTSAVAVLLAGAIGFLNVLETNAQSSNAAAAAVSGPHDVLLRLHAEPPQARIRLDGLPQPGNPTEVRVAAGSEHTIEISLQGYRTLTRKFRFDHETSLELALVVERPPVAASTSAVPAPMTPQPARAGATKSRSNAPDTDDLDAKKHTLSPADGARSADAKKHATETEAATATAESKPRVSASPDDDPCAVPFYFSNGIKTYKPECLRAP